MALAHNIQDNTKVLDFYESMYHLKKMFPKFDIDVIEAVLRANNGTVDSTIDQLLTMSIDDDLIDEENEFQKKTAASAPPLVVTSKISTTTSSSSINYNLSTFTHDNDLPPSYNDLLPRFNSYAQQHQSDTNSICTTTSSSSSTATIDSNDNQHQHYHHNHHQNQMTSITKLLNSVLIGKLPRDFLRIKLTSEQLKQLRNTNEYKDKYKSSHKKEDKTECLGELAANLNNNEIRKNYEENCKLLRRNSIQQQKCKGYNQEMSQLLQDEYLAILIQNEEFLNQLKENKDFVNTLNMEFEASLLFQNTENSTNPNDTNIQPYSPHTDMDYNYGDDNLRLNHPFGMDTTSAGSNDEFKRKLARMGTISRIKFAKLAKLFTKKSKTTYLKSDVSFNDLYKSETYNHYDTIQNNNEYTYELNDDQYNNRESTLSLGNDSTLRIHNLNDLNQPRKASNTKTIDLLSYNKQENY